MIRIEKRDGEEWLVDAPVFSGCQVAAPGGGLCTQHFDGQHLVTGPGDGSSEPIYARWPIDPTRCGATGAPAPAPPRSAEEIAREMVTVEYDKDTGAHYAVIWDRKVDVEVCLGDASTEAGARDEAKAAEGILARVYERGRTEGMRAVSLGAPVDRLSFDDVEALSGVGWIDDGGTWRHGPSESAWEPSPENLAALRRIAADLRDKQEPRANEPAQPRDLAGRIRALVQEYAGRVADPGTDEHTVVAVCAILRFLGMAARVARDARAPESIEHIIREMRAGAVGNPRSYVFAMRAEAADRLEAIVREAEGGR